MRTIELTTKAKAICKANWITDKRGKPTAQCCANCPLRTPCSTWYPTTYEGIDKHVAGVNAAAEEVA
jgi:hypothetical protein